MRVGAFQKTEFLAGCLVLIKVCYKTVGECIQLVQKRNTCERGGPK